MIHFFYVLTPIAAASKTCSRCKQQQIFGLQQRNFRMWHTGGSIFSLFASFLFLMMDRHLKLERRFCPFVQQWECASHQRNVSSCYWLEVGAHAFGLSFLVHVCMWRVGICRGPTFECAKFSMLKVNRVTIISQQTYQIQTCRCIKAVGVL